MSATPPRGGGQADSRDDGEQRAPRPAPLNHDQERLNRSVLLGLLLLSTLAFIPLMYIFTVPIVLAATFTTLFYPAYVSMLRMVRGRRMLASLLTCLLLLLGLLIPAYLLVVQVVQQMIGFYSSVRPALEELIAQGTRGDIVRRITESPLFQRLQFVKVDWGALLQNAVGRLGALGTVVVNRTSAGVFGLMTNLFIMFFTMFYFFIDGQSLLDNLRYLVPIKREYADRIFSRFLLTARATVMGTLVIGIVQGTVGSLTLLIAGVDTWLVWGFIMVILSIIPMVGPWLILVPAGVIQLILGNIWQGILILLSSFLVVSSIDNLIRPRLVGHGAQMHDLLIFFSTVGGLGIFGVMGFIVGPVIAALFVSILDIYRSEFQPQLQAMENGAREEEP